LLTLLTFYVIIILPWFPVCGTGETCGNSRSGGQKAVQRSIWLILIIYLLLAVACSALNPLFEAPDEQHHYFTARSIAETQRLPIVSEDSLARQEAAQPPLYYMVSALIIAPIDASSSQPQLIPNPFVRLGHFDSQINVNAFAHTPSEAWPWRGTSLAVHLVRLFSVLLGAGTLLCIYASGLILWPEKPYRALLAAALVGFLPQYVFLHSAVSNDSLIIFLSSVALWQVMRLWLDRATGWRVFALGRPLTSTRVV
jgi:4-amino-4-deoxy-L-arabinose transferase-like glycosyltransferase